MVDAGVPSSDPITGYAAFVSYSHQSDRVLGSSLKSAIERFPRPWWRSRRRRVFLDKGNLAADPSLWSSIEKALAASRWFLLLASPDAARSSWVDREVRWWLEHRSSDHLLIVLTGGDVAWDKTTGMLDLAQTTALPPALTAASVSEPLWVDLRKTRAVPFDVEHDGWRESLADLVAPLDEVPKDTLIGEHLRYRRRTHQLAGSIITTLATLLIVAVVAGLLAVEQRNKAQAQTLLVTSRQLVAEVTAIRDSQPDLARQLLAQAYRLAPTDQVVGALVESASIPRVIPTRGLSRGVAVSPQRDMLAIVSDAGITLHSIASGATISTLNGSEGYTQTVAFSPDDRLLAAGGADGKVRIFDITTAASPVLLNTLPVAGPDDIVATVAFATGSVLAVALSNAAFGLWNITDPFDPQTLVILPGFSTAFYPALAISPVGQLIATTGEDNTIILWDISDPRAPTVRTTLRGHGGQVTALSFDPRGQILASGAGDDTTRLWNVTNPGNPSEQAVLSGQSLGIDALAFTPDGTRLATGAGDTTIQLWDLADLLRPTQGAVLTGHTDGVRGMVFSPDGRKLASASADGSKGDANLHSGNSTVRLWTVVDAARSEALARLSPGARVVPTFTPDGRFLASGFPTTIWAITDRSRPQMVATVSTFNQGGQATAFSPDGRQLASGDPAVLWDTTDPANPRDLTPDVERTDGADVVLFSPTAPLVVTATGSPLQMWDVSGEQPALAATLTGAAATDQGAAFALDGTVLAAHTDDGTVQLWDVTDQGRPRPLSALGASRNTIESVAFGPDSNTLVTGSTMGVVTVWNIGDTEDPVEVSSTARHTGRVAGVVVQPGGSLVASASEDGTVRLWSLSDRGRLIEVAMLQAGGRFDSPLIAFSPDGRTLAAADDDGVALWDVDIRGILQRLCAESPAITPADWNRYLPNLPYDPPCATRARE